MKTNILSIILLQALLCATPLSFTVQARPCSAHENEPRPALYVNLQDFPLYLKRGFDPKDSAQPDVHDGSWLEKKPFSNVIISKLGLPDLPKRTFLSFFGKKEEEFTFVIPFTLSGIKNLPTTVTPGLFLAGIGDNWEIYLNGTLTRSEMHLEKDSLKIRRHHSQRRVFFPLPIHILKEGDNILVFRIVGDPTDQTVGFQYSRPFYIGDYKSITSNNDETLEMVFIGGYLLVAAYHFLLFISRRKDIHNLYCGLFSALMGLYYLSRTHNIYNYIPDTAILVKIEFFCIFLVIPALAAFVETLCAGKISKFTRLYSAVFAFLALSQIILPRPYGSDSLIVWQILGIAALLHILTSGVLLVFIREVKEGKRQYALQGAKDPGIIHFMAETYSGNLLIGVGVVVLSSIADILDSLLFHYSLNLTRYSLYLFVMTVTLMLARIYGKLNNALQAKQIFLANMSHEIRTPLNAIMGTAEQIAREHPPEAVMTKIKSIKQAGATLISIINDILDFSRLEAVKMKIVNREYRFRPLIDEVADIISARLAGKDVRFAARIDPVVPETLVGDALRIRQILLNLLWNAVKFTSHGKIELHATLKNAPLSLILTVSDTGKGIKRQELEAIFTEFYQMDSKLHQGSEGTGLGLSICKKLCLLMGGEISVRSEYGKGSVFTVIMPQQPGTGSLGSELVREKMLFEKGVGFPNAKALIVEDTESNREVMLGLLKSYGLEPDTAINGKDAVSKAESQDYDIIFMDQVMEDDMDGVATAAALRQLPGHSQTPIVALTANAMTGMREFFLNYGFQDYISKPVDPFLLDDILVRWLPEKKQTRGKAQDSRPENPTRPLPEPAGAVRMETALQRLDLLAHYRWHFSTGLPADPSYCNNFGLLMDALITDLATSAPETPALIPPNLREKAAILAEAGRQGDAETIRHNLPGVYSGLAALLTPPTKARTMAEGNPAKRGEPAAAKQDMPGLNKKLRELKDALEQNNSSAAGAIMAEVKDLPEITANRELRELYFLLYDLMIMDETQKAAGALALWSKFAADKVQTDSPGAGSG